MKFIIISATTANSIRGKHGRHSEVDPIPIGDGKYIIPERILNDPELKEIWDKIPVSNPRKTIDEIKAMYPDFQKWEDEF